MSSSRKVAAIIVAAGRGERAGQSIEGPKQYRSIGGEAVITHTLRALANHPAIDRIMVAIHPDDENLFEQAIVAFHGNIASVHGGATRQDSVFRALTALKDHAPDIVLIHDAVRPFIDESLISRVIETADSGFGALPAIAVSDTLKRADANGLVLDTVSRSGLYAAQTPQGFPYSLLLNAHEKAAKESRSDFTDDAALAEWTGLEVKIIEGLPDNVKLTWARDIILADQRLTKMTPFYPDVRVGNGYDVHALVEGDHVILCGVKIPYHLALSGHSDADVGLHALTDALLATCNLGDIGTHFPPSDPKWKGAASRQFVEHAVKLVRERKGRISNIDITFIAEAPKIGPHRVAMTEELSDMLGISLDRVSVKASTNEKLGFIGRGEGISAIATATVVFPGELSE